MFGCKADHFILLLVILAALACGACDKDNEVTIDLRDGGATLRMDGGFTDGGLSSEDFVIRYIAPEGVSSVAFGSNLSGQWVGQASVAGREVSWTGRLDLRKIDLAACTATAVNQDCGYVVNASFNAWPNWAYTLDGANCRSLGTWYMTGPIAIAFDPVLNGIGGCNGHVRRR